MRQMAPISPALHLGAERILVIGVRQEEPSKVPRPERIVDDPSLAQIAGHVLNSIFLDSLESDLERLQRINNTLSLVASHHMQNLALHQIETLVISPSEDLGKIAECHKQNLPRPLRFFLRATGALNREASDLVSYLLFDRSYCRELIELGYADTIRRKDEVLRFLSAPAAMIAPAIAEMIANVS